MKSLSEYIFNEAKLNSIKEGETYYCWSSELGSSIFKVTINKVEETADYIVGHTKQNSGNIIRLNFEKNFKNFSGPYFNAYAILSTRKPGEGGEPVIIATSAKDIKQIVSSEHSEEIEELQDKIAEYQKEINKLNKKLNKILKKIPDNV